MKKMLLTLTTVGALAIPAGVLVAQSDQAEPIDEEPGTTEPVQDRARRADDAPATADEENSVEARECDGSGPMARRQEQCEADGEGPYAHRREQNRVEEGAGEGPMTRQRRQHRVEDCAVDGAPDTQQPAGGQADTDPDDGANLQRRYGQDD